MRPILTTTFAGLLFLSAGCAVNTETPDDEVTESNDDLRTGTELLKNGGFESNLRSWDLAVGDSPGEATIVDAPAWKHLYLRGGKTKPSTISQDISATGGKRYRVKLSSMIEQVDYPGSAGFRLEVDYLAKNGALLKQQTKALTPSEQTSCGGDIGFCFSKETTKLTSEAPARTATLRVTVFAPKVGLGRSVRLDDVSVKEVL